MVTKNETAGWDRGGFSEYFLDDKESARELVNLMPADAKAQYQAFKFLRKFSAFPGRVLVVYTLKNGAPVDVELVRFSALEVDESGHFTTGRDETGEIQQISATPGWWMNRDIFFQLPQTFEFSLKAKRSGINGLEFSPHFAILVKTRSRPDEMAEGHTQCMTFNDFRASYPDIRIRY